MTFTEPQPPSNRHFGAILFGVILTLTVLAITLFSGCKSAEQKQAKLYGKFDKLKRKADADSVLKVVPPKWSLDNFPITVGKGKTIFLPGRTIIKHDTITETKTVKDTVYVTKTITKHHYKTDTLHTTDTIVDNRPLSQLQHDYRALDAKLIQSITKAEIATKTKNKQRGKMLWSIGLNLLLLLVIIAYFLRKFGIIN